MPKKCILILLDGLGDRSCHRLNNKTPLQAAHTPTLDKIAAGGANGLYHAAMIGQALPSENAHFSLFGYDMADFPGRGVLEAVGAGIDVSSDDVALLSHFVSLSEKNGAFFLDRGKPEADKDEIAKLSDCIKSFRMDGVRVTLHPTGGIRNIVILSGDVSPFITDSDPFIDEKPLVAILPWQKFQKDAAAKKTADILKAYLIWAYRQLNSHNINSIRKRSGRRPLNGLVTQRAGRLKKVEPFFNKYGLKGLIMASGMVYWGLASYIGMSHEKMIDTGDPGADFEQRINRAHACLSEYDLVHVHTKTPDEAAHTKNPLLKKEVIESLDAGIGRAMGPILDDPDILVVITADHSTPSNGPLIHSGESVPIVFSGSGVRRDKVERFDEISAPQGALGILRGKELIYMVLNHLERSKLAGIMDTPVDQPYWPGNYKQFMITS